MGYASVNNLEESQKSVTKSANINQRLALSYRNEWLEIELSGGVGYNHSRNDLQTNNNLDTWQYSYGGMVGITAPWGTALTTNLNMQSRRGYKRTDTEYNSITSYGMVHVIYRLNLFGGGKNPFFGGGGPGGPGGRPGGGRPGGGRPGGFGGGGRRF